MCDQVQLLHILLVGESKLNKVLNTCDFVLDESNKSTYDENSYQFNSEIDYMDKTLPTSLPIMKQKYIFLHITKMCS